MIDATGYVIDSKVIKPWEHGCWSEDGHRVPCDRTAGGKLIRKLSRREHNHCAYHRQWIRIAGDNAMVAFVEPAKKDPTLYEACAWDPGLEEWIELGESMGFFRSTKDAREAADAALVKFIEAHQKGGTS